MFMIDSDTADLSASRLRFIVPRSFSLLLASARLSFFEQSSLLPGPSDVCYKKCKKKRERGERNDGEKKVGETL